MNENSIKNLIAGLFVVFMVFVMIFIGFFLSGGFKDQGTITFVTNFKSISGLNVGSDVSYKGFSIGKVSNISINKNNPKLVSVYMKINSQIPIYKQTVATLQSMGITGQSKVELSLDINEKNTSLDLLPIKKGQIPMIKSKPSQLESILNKVSAIASSLEEISDKFNKMMSPENLERFNEFTDSVNILLYNLSNSSIYFNKTLMNLNETMTESQETITRLNNVIRILEYDPSTIVRGINHEE
ncbi:MULTISPECIES: MlaD family protein [Francisella]|uniref:MCE family protein n=1 Tax=Francisella opportunistica TaxID=2016517 RepID=A0A345JQI5_9GAMM|nr:MULTISPECIES: MlaD family protein [Francisella]APC91286.1 ABC-type transport system involved in resistance to organic solvents, periplasmic component [Francisella sp. MA067296]AXH29581.1 MCE family protein [Francisella opportunistica]AXH31232.1 MCE family protein [Francisella opportunistica]AXH32879.1 MCE family protein [Francisella opportunistica]